jgi:hypothetical protein
MIDSKIYKKGVNYLLIKISSIVCFAFCVILCQEDILIELNLGHITSIGDVWNDDTYLRLYNSTHSELCAVSVVQQDEKHTVDKSGYVVNCLVKQYLPYSHGKPTELYASLYSKESGHTYATFDVSYTAEAQVAAAHADSAVVDDVGDTVVHRPSMHVIEQKAHHALIAISNFTKSYPQAIIAGVFTGACYQLDVFRRISASVLPTSLANRNINIGAGQEGSSAQKYLKSQALRYKNGDSDPFQVWMQDISRMSQFASTKTLATLKGSISRPHRLYLPPKVNQFFSSKLNVVKSRTDLAASSLLIAAAPLFTAIRLHCLQVHDTVNKRAVSRVRHCIAGVRSRAHEMLKVANESLPLLPPDRVYTVTEDRERLRRLYEELRNDDVAFPPVSMPQLIL